AARCLRDAAEARLVPLCEGFAHRLGRQYGRISLRDVRSRWGSCSSAGNLMFSWRLVMAPPEVLAYVAAHEVAHLAEMNHSPAFWAQVTRLMPGWRDQRAWLRENGGELQSYRFEG
ncbi:M48 family metallopeptidase, partial [Alkalilacustris brevis]|uniref:M48 family metallopeptidase n=1 Tax=Alkalilacustris brevis TaxID=2026338 RepID=UPI0012D2FF36